MITKQQVIERVERLPDSASLADIREELEIIAALATKKGSLATKKGSLRKNIKGWSPVSVEPHGLFRSISCPVLSAFGLGTHPYTCTQASSGQFFAPELVKVAGR